MATPAPTLTMPPRPYRIITGGQVPQPAGLSAVEIQNFVNDFGRLATVNSLERDLSNLLQKDYDFFLYACAVAKASVGQSNGSFQGVTAIGNDVGMQIIRAVTVMNPGIAVGGTPVLKWPQTYAAAGWKDVFGSQANPVNLSQTGSSGSSATNTQHRVMLAITGLLNSTPPLLSEYRFHIGTADYPVQNVNWVQSVDLAYAPLLNPILIAVDQQFWMRGNIINTGTDGTQLFGLTFSTGNYLVLEA